MIFELMPYRACFPILKVFYSAAANGNHNKDFKKEDLVITKAEVNEGNTVKKTKSSSSTTELCDKKAKLSYTY
ncbi:unnamed protein product [Linum tenue]|uniref:Uncharacterized protein n=1 Tax=Linum tenue TaxID=586396 RepID=A0AAV0MH45_9ROSI|nr:unnamed protein product [Linum tenue]